MTNHAPARVTNFDHGVDTEGGEVDKTSQAFCGVAAGRTADPWCPVAH